MSDKNETIEYTSKLYLAPRKDETGFVIRDGDWSRIMRIINSFSSGTRWWELAFTSLLSLSVAFWFTDSQFTGDSVIPLILKWIFSTAALVSLVALIVQKKQDGNTKKEIISELELIHKQSVARGATGENKLNDATDVKPETLPNWSAHKTNHPQGVDFKQVPFSDGLLNTLNFSVFSNSPYWRAGLKLVAPNVEGMPDLLTPNSLLFHIEIKNGKASLSIYQNGGSGGRIHKTLPKVDTTKPIIITAERNENNYIQCYVNDSIEFNERIDHNVFKKAYLAAWGDDFDYEVGFSDIQYTVAN